MMTRSRGRFAITAPGTCLAAALAAVFAASSALALPRYSARYEQRCDLCHQNPTGSGPRTTYASQFIVPGEMSMKKYTQEEMATLMPQINPAITVGFDYRTMYHWENGQLNPPVFETSYKNFFQMEGNMYVSVQLDPKFSAHLTRGMTSTSEIYGLAYVLPASGYVKAGQFVPVYGWKFDDHTSFVRGQIGETPGGSFRPPGETDVGVEVGIQPGRLFLAGAVMNGNPGVNFDGDRNRAYTGQALLRGRLGRLGVGVGGSALRNHTSAGKVLNRGPLWYVKAGRITWLGETDWSKTEPAGGGKTTALVTSHEFSLLARRGVELLATYDFYDPDVDQKSGARVRYGVGTEIMPRPFLSLRGMLTMYRPDVGPALAGLGIETRNFNQVEMQAHIFY